ncbi:hypothetical protein [Shimia biformata]|uniref:hypothetical protein n=1 Tax=Shimia biformata TaxID=1294299 RepID=UPI0019527710|nr:hypothetical protein [Shimia biformata]
MQRAFWFSFIAAGAVYLTMILWSLPFIASEAGGLVPFDMRPMGYDLDEAKAFVAGISERGRAFYLGTQHRLDLIYPALLALALVLGLQLLYRRPWSSVLGVLALMGAASDFLENQFVTTLLLTPPAEIDSRLVGVASFWTMSKSITTTICFAALLLGAGRLVWRRVVG